MNKKILLLITGGEMGGAQMVVYELARQLKRQNYAVTVGVGAQGDWLPAALAQINCETKIFPDLKRNFNFIASYKFFRDCKKYLQADQFDILHLHSSNTIVAGLAAQTVKNKPKTIFTFHGLSYLDPNHRGWMSKIVFYLAFKFFLRWVDQPVFTGRQNLAYAQKIKLVKDGAVIYNGVDIDYLSRPAAQTELEKKLGISLAGKTVIGSIGRLAYPKNYELLISTATALVKKLPHLDLLFIILGDGPEKSHYQTLIGKNKLEKIFFLAGEVANGGQYLKAFDIFVLTSLYEGTPLTLIEALRAGLPTLAPAVGCIPEILAGSPEQLFRVNNGNDLAEHFFKILTDNNLRQEIIQKNLAASVKFSSATMVEQYLKVFFNE